MANSTTVSTIVAAGLKVGASAGTALTQVTKGTVSVTIGAIAAAAESDISVTITGAAAGDIVIMTPNDSSMETGVSVQAVWVSAANTVKIRVSNLHTSTLAGSTANWSYMLIK